MAALVHATPSQQQQQQQQQHHLHLHLQQHAMPPSDDAATNNNNNNNTSSNGLSAFTQVAAPERFVTSWQRELERERTIKAGWLEKRGEKRHRWKRRWFVLRSTRFAYYKDDGEYSPLGILRLSDIHSVSATRYSDSRLHVLAIVTRQRTYYLEALGEYEVQGWIKAFYVVMQNLRHFASHLNIAQAARSQSLANITPTIGGSGSSSDYIQQQSLATGSNSAATPPISIHQQRRHLRSAPAGNSPIDFNAATTPVPASPSDPQLSISIPSVIRHVDFGSLSNSPSTELGNGSRQHSFDPVPPTPLNMNALTYAHDPITATTDEGEGSTSEGEDAAGSDLDLDDPAILGSGGFSSSRQSRVRFLSGNALPPPLGEPTLTSSSITALSTSTSASATLVPSASPSLQRRQHPSAPASALNSPMASSSHPLHTPLQALSPGDGPDAPLSSPSPPSAALHDPAMSLIQKQMVHKSGWLLKQGKSAVKQTWKKRWCVLRQDTLTIFKDEREYSAQRVIQLSRVIDTLTADAPKSLERYLQSSARQAGSSSSSTSGSGSFPIASPPTVSLPGPITTTALSPPQRSLSSPDSPLPPPSTHASTPSLLPRQSHTTSPTLIPTTTTTTSTTTRSSPPTPLALLSPATPSARAHFIDPLPYCFQVVTPRKTFLFAADSADDKASWVRDVKRLSRALR
ncbi:Pleckstrin y domain-containing H member 2 [Sorochytrium milnesiophthora]